MTRIGAAFGIVLTLAAVVPPTAINADQKIATCYSLPTPSGGIGAMTVTGGGALTYAEEGQPLVLFSDYCDLRMGERTTCALECDGGRLHFTLDEGGLLVEAEGRRVETMRFDSLLNLSSSLDVDGWNLNGSWKLRSSDPAACRELETRAPRIALQPGDVHPWVGEIERFLLAGGYFLDGPDMVYDGATAEAVRLYQRRLGLKETGRADRVLLQRMAVDTVLAFGGC